MRVRASTGYFRLEALGAALCKQQRAGEHRGEAAVARRQCRSQRRGTGCSYMNTCMCISPYVFIRMKGSCSNLYPSLHLCIYMHSARALTRARSHAYMKTCTYTHLMSERELRHEYPYLSEVFVCGYLNVTQTTLYLDDIRLIHTSNLC